ncbi:MAG: hypothetical protein RL732_1177 [Bacteroidota bacterium]|jgi:hypothetical protein
MVQLLRKSFPILLLFSTWAAAATAQATKPRIMVFPAENWMRENKFYTMVSNQGKEDYVWDFKKALIENKELYSVINKIGMMFAERNFPLEDLNQKLNDLKEQDALNQVDQSASGAGVAESMRDKLLKVAKPDIILEVNWTVNSLGPKKSITFDLKGLDAGTNKQVAAASGTGNPSFSLELPVLLQEAVLSHITGFQDQLMASFTDMFENGREISLDIRVWDNSPKKLNDEINEDGDELKDDIKNWVKKNTVKGRFNLMNASPNFMAFTGVRIPVVDSEGSAMDADAFSASLRKYLRKTYQLKCESGARGLGKAEVTIGDKR